MDNIRVDPYESVPKYHQLYTILRRRVEEKHWSPHEAIPSERDLEIQYDVSRTTVRKALDMLVSDGFLYRAHGRGTFVARPKLRQSLQLLASFTDDMRMRGFKPDQKILSLGRVEPSAHMRQRLELPAEASSVIRVERLRYADGDPIALHTAYLALTPEQEITRAELTAQGSLYQLLEQKFNLIVAEADQTIDAIVASEREAALLQVPVGNPLLFVVRTTWSHRRRPMELVEMRYRADSYSLTIHMTR